MDSERHLWLLSLRCQNETAPIKSSSESSWISPIPLGTALLVHNF